MRDPFDLSDTTIRDWSHVRVTRHAPAGGRPCEYRKVFKPDGLGHAAYWIQRENDFLMVFALKKLRHTVEPSTMAWSGDEAGLARMEWIATRDAGITVEDWLRVRPRYAGGDSLRHPFCHAGQCLRLLRACLVALEEIHRHGIVHCDIKEDNICLPYTPYPFQDGQPVNIDFDRIHLIDFAFAITPERPLEQPLPIVGKADYQSRQLKEALAKDGLCEGPDGFRAQRLDCRVDLYSLGHMMGRIVDAGLLQPEGADGRAALEAARELVERLRAFDQKPLDGLPHSGLIAEIDGLLGRLDCQAYDSFTVERREAQPPCLPTPPTPLAQTLVAGPQRPAKPGLLLGISSFLGKLMLKIVRTIFHPFFIPVDILIVVLFAFAMKSGILDRTGICGLIDSDRQIRECKIFGVEIWAGPNHYPKPDIQFPSLSGNNTKISSDGLLKLAVEKNKYRIGDLLEIDYAIAKPLYVKLMLHDSSGGIETLYPRDGKSIVQLVADKVYEFPPPESNLEVKIQAPVGQDHIIAIATEQPMSDNLPLLKSDGSLTQEALELSPTVVRLDYGVLE